jgi:hypothetical protein
VLRAYFKDTLSENISKPKHQVQSVQNTKVLQGCYKAFNAIESPTFRTISSLSVPDEALVAEGLKGRRATAVTSPTGRQAGKLTTFL